MDNVLSETSSDQDIVRFDIMMDEMSSMDVFKKIYLSIKLENDALIQH